MKNSYVRLEDVEHEASFFIEKNIEIYRALALNNEYFD